MGFHTFKRKVYFLILLWHRHIQRLALESARCVVQIFVLWSESEFGRKWTPAATGPVTPDRVSPSRAGVGLESLVPQQELRREPTYGFSVLPAEPHFQG